MSEHPVAARQVPERGALTLDHVAHFIPDADLASAVLEGLGFTLTPFSVQSHRLTDGGPLVPAGTGNRCVMLGEGYLEFLTPLADTPNAAQLRAAMNRYTGVHLIAFGTGAPELDYARLLEASFEPLHPVALQRPISVEGGMDTARFTVVRVPPGGMAEGRVQDRCHHTPELVWQPRWTTHANGSVSLDTVVVCVADPDEAARRYARYTGLTCVRSGHAHYLETARGTIVLVDPRSVERTLALEPPALPWIAGYALGCRDPAQAGEAAARVGCIVRELAGGRFAAVLPEALGGVMIFQQPEIGPMAFE